MRRAESESPGSTNTTDTSSSGGAEGVGSGQGGGQGRLLFCVQEEGDVLYVPHGWGHSTLNLRER